MKTIFDLHVHPLGKRFLYQYDQAIRENKNTYDKPTDLSRMGNRVNDLVGKIFNSQATVSQCLEAGVHLAVAPVVAIERVFTAKNFLLKLLDLSVNDKNLLFPLDPEYFDYLRRSDSHYKALFDAETGFYQWVGALNDKVNILNRKTPNLQLQANKFNILMAIEGGHTLAMNSPHQRPSAVRLRQLVKDLRTKKDLPDFLYLTLTHLSNIPEQPLCNHAYGFKLAGGVSDSYPQVAGLTALGQMVVRTCMDCSKRQKNPILVDIKHTSLKGRQDIYAYRKKLMEEGFTVPKDKDGNPWWPLLATHMGVSGYRSADMPGRMKKVGHSRKALNSVRVKLERVRAGKVKEGAVAGNEYVYFNPLSISLFDDDIEEIARSKGLIGISMDARILGFENTFQRMGADEDFFSFGDFKSLYPQVAKTLDWLWDEAEEQEAYTQEGLLDRFTTGRYKREVMGFCFNVLHTVAVINNMFSESRHNKMGWDFICMGSDYDGLIDSPEAANTITDIPNFISILPGYFRSAAKAYRKEFNYDGPLFPPRADDPEKDDIEALIRLFFYENGPRFVQDWWGLLMDDE